MKTLIEDSPKTLLPKELLGELFYAMTMPEEKGIYARVVAVVTTAHLIGYIEGTIETVKAAPSGITQDEKNKLSSMKDTRIRLQLKSLHKYLHFGDKTKRRW
mgnify:CR=1 FL=1